jgi:protein MpaA
MIKLFETKLFTSSKVIKLSYLICALLFSTISGCYRPLGDSGNEYTINPSAGTSVFPKHILGTSVQNRPIELYEFGTGTDVIFLIGSIHGDETAGTGMLWKLMDLFIGNPELLNGRKVLIMPVANPDGKAVYKRYNANGVDINRNFSTLNRINKQKYGLTALSEPESRAIARIIQQYQPDRIVSIHRPFACIDYDGPGEALAKRMAEYCNLPVKPLGTMPGSLGSYAGLQLKIPTITVELPKRADRLTSQNLLDIYGKMILAAVMYPDNIEN